MTKIYFSQFWVLKIQDQRAYTGWVLVKILLQDADRHLLCLVLSPGGKGINLINVPQFPPSHTDTLGFSISTNKFLEYTHVETIADRYRNCD